MRWGGRERVGEGGRARERELTQINLAESYMCVFIVLVFQLCCKFEFFPQKVKPLTFKAIDLYFLFNKIFGLPMQGNGRFPSIPGLNWLLC